MSGRRTEPPTPRRLREARRRGEVARSRRLAAGGALGAALLSLAAVGPEAASSLRAEVRRALAAAAAEAPVEPAVASALDLLLGLTVVPCLAAAAGGAMAAALSQGFRLSSAPIAFRWGRLRPRFPLSGRSLGASAFAAFEAAVAAFLALRRIDAGAPALVQAPRLPWLGLPALAGSLLVPLAVELAGLLLAFGLLELGWSRWRLRVALRMTREEVRRDRRDEEGDPHHRAERRRLHRALASAGPVARATCVVVNPEHLAVAIRHERSGDEAPRVVAKGAGAEAARIRTEARRSGVPLVRDVELARALHRLADVGEEIPEELYRAAAAVLVHVYREAAAGRRA